RTADAAEQRAEERAREVDVLGLRGEHPSRLLLQTREAVGAEDAARRPDAGDALANRRLALETADRGGDGIVHALITHGAREGVKRRQLVLTLPGAHDTRGPCGAPATSASRSRSARPCRRSRSP